MIVSAAIAGRTKARTSLCRATFRSARRTIEWTWNESLNPSKATSNKEFVCRAWRQKQDRSPIHRVDVYSITGRGRGGFYKTLENYSLDKMVSPSLHRTESSPTSTVFQVQLSPLSSLKVTQDTTDCKHPQAGRPRQAQVASQQSEDSWVWHCEIYTRGLLFSKLLAILCLFKQRTHVQCSIFSFENAPAEHLHGYHGNYQVASSWAWSWDCQQASQNSSILFLPRLIF